MTNKQKKLVARSLYLKSQMNRKQIANQVNVTEKTLRKWIDEGDWDTVKEAETISRKELLREAYAQLRAINKKINDELGGVPDKQLADAKGVIRREIEALSEMPLHRYVEMAMELTNWVQHNEPQKLISITEALDGFIQDVAVINN